MASCAGVALRLSTTVWGQTSWPAGGLPAERPLSCLEVRDERRQGRRSSVHLPHHCCCPPHRMHELHDVEAAEHEEARDHEHDPAHVRRRGAANQFLSKKEKPCRVAETPFLGGLITTSSRKNVSQPSTCALMSISRVPRSCVISSSLMSRWKSSQTSPMTKNQGVLKRGKTSQP